MNTEQINDLVYTVCDLLEEFNVPWDLAAIFRLKAVARDIAALLEVEFDINELPIAEITAEMEKRELL